MNAGELFSRAGAFVAWLFGVERKVSEPFEPRRNLLYEEGRKAFLGGGLDWSQNEHKVVLQDAADVQIPPVMGARLVTEGSFPPSEFDPVYITYDQSGKIEALIDVKEFRDDGIVFVDGDGREEFLPYQTVDEDEDEDEITGVFERP